MFSISSSSVVLIGGHGDDSLQGGFGSDTLRGGGGDDTLAIYYGGNDTVNGGAGNDVIQADYASTGASGYTSADTIQGGSGDDVLLFSGYAYGPLEFGGNLHGIETIALAMQGEGLDVTVDDALLSGRHTITIDASAFAAVNVFTGLVFDGSAETSGAFHIIGSSYDDTIRDGAGDDVVGTGGGNNTVVSGGGSDTYVDGFGNGRFLMGATLDAGDRIDGGFGDDVVELDGDYSAGLILRAGTIQNVAELRFDAGHSYWLTTSDGNVAGAETLLVDGAALTASNVLKFDGHLERDGILTLEGGAGNDVLIGGGQNDALAGGAGNDLLTGGGGADMLTGGAGADVFAYGAVGDSSPKASHTDYDRGLPSRRWRPDRPSCRRCRHRHRRRPGLPPGRRRFHGRCGRVDPVRRRAWRHDGRRRRRRRRRCGFRDPARRRAGPGLRRLRALEAAKERPPCGVARRAGVAASAKAGRTSGRLLPPPG